MSVKMKLIRMMMRKMGAGMFSAGEVDVEGCRKTLEQAYAQHKVERGVSVELLELGGVETAIYTPDESAATDRVVYYVHGGGLITGDRQTAGPYASQLALACACPVVSCSYRLAPENPFPAGLDDTCVVYRAILERWPGAKICATGESGGAHLSLALALACKKNGWPIPAGLVLDSIVASMDEGLIERPEAPDDAVVSGVGLASLADMYARGALRLDPLCSNILGDYEGLPPMRIVYDAGEYLAPDSVAVAVRARAAGVEVEVEAYEGCFHAFTTTGKDTPESARELKLAAAFMNRCFS